MATTISNKPVRFGAVEFQAALKCASAKDDVKFDRARRYVWEKPDGKPEVRFERVVRPDRGALTDNPANADNIVYGIWTDDDTFKPVPADTLAAIKLLGETEQVGKLVRDLTAIEIEEFVDLKDVEQARFTSAYFLAPQKGGIGAKPMKLLYEALKAEKAAGVFKFVLKGGGRQKLGVLHPSNGKLLLNVLCYADEWKQSDEAAEALAAIAKPEKVYVDHARALIRALKVDAADSLLETARDTAIEAKAEAYQKVLDGETIKKREISVIDNGVDDLMERLKASMDQAAKKGKKVAA